MSIKGFSVGGNVERYDYNFLDNRPSEITVDTALSDSSTNPVQNSAVTNAINAANGSISSVSGEVDDLKSALNTLTLGIDDDDGLLYLYVNGVKQGEGIELGGTGTRYTITYNLAPNMVSSNTAGRVTEGNSYQTTISSSNADYQIDDITVSMGSTDITTSSVDGSIISIPSVTGNVVITVTAVFYPAPVTDESSVQVESGGNGTLRIKLHAQPTQNQTISLHSDALTLDATSLIFTPANWDTYQTVNFSAPNIDDTTYAYISIINSDPLMTESTVVVVIEALDYSDLVDTTIPSEGLHTVTADDFTSTSVYGDYIRLYGYNAEYDNIKIPSTLNGKIPWVVCTASSPTASNTTFSYGNTTIKYVTFEDGVIYRSAGTTSGCSAEALFRNCTSLIGVSNMNTDVTNLTSAFYGCTALEFVDNLDELVNVTNDNQAFIDCTSLEYVQDLSNWTKVGLRRTFRGCSSLKKVFGLPQPDSAATFEYAFMGTQVEKVTIPENASSLVYCFHQNSHVNNVTILADGLTTNNMATIFGSSQTQNIDVYANAGSTTYESLQSMFASSTKVTVHDLSGSSLPSIVVWGDSTSSPNRSWIEWPRRLQSKLGTSEYLVKNEAVSGEWTTSTSARQGGNAIHTDAFEIPEDTTAALVTLTTADNQTFSNAPIFSAGGSYNPCKIGGVDGVISKNGADYYFTRANSGNAASIASGSIVTSDKDAEFNANGNVMLINIGHNSGWNGDAATLVNQMQLMVNHFLALGGTDYIVTGPWSGTWISTDSGWAVTQQVSSLASTAFGSHWLDLPGEMAANCQADNPNVSWTSEDLAYIAAGKTPLPSLTYDNTHPTEAGANSQMMAFYRKGVVLGYWS